MARNDSEFWGALQKIPNPKTANAEVSRAKAETRTVVPATPAEIVASPQKPIFAGDLAGTANLAGTAMVRSLSDPNGAMAQFNPNAFPKDKQPASVKQAYVEVQLQRLLSMARHGQCAEAVPALEDIGQMDQSLPFTYTKFNAFIKRSHFQYYMGMEKASAARRKRRKRGGRESVTTTNQPIPLITSSRCWQPRGCKRVKQRKRLTQPFNNRS